MEDVVKKENRNESRNFFIFFVNLRKEG